MRVVAIAPSEDVDLAEALLAIQHAAYGVEARLIGDDRIPPLHEEIGELRAAPLSWFGAFDDGGQLIGSVAWNDVGDGVDIDRLVVDPGAHRQGVGRALVRAVLSQAGNRTTTVWTGRANVPARTLYQRLGFEAVEDSEVEPGLWVTRLVRTP
ncbi:MAG TPA: GNAT family N-acetyltransferase [Mycobacteriales bacterium]